jgi:hypothetical protein
MAIYTGSPYSSAGPIGKGKLIESMPPGLGLEGLGLAPTGAGRALYGCGIALMIIFGWLGFSTWARPDVSWSEVPGVEVEVPRATTTNGAGQLVVRTHAVVFVSIPVPTPGTYIVTLPGDDSGPQYDRISHELSGRYFDPGVTASSTGTANGSPDSLVVSATLEVPVDAETHVVRVVAIPAVDPPTEVHLPTFLRDVMMVAIGFAMFVVGFTLRHRYVKALREKARSIEQELEAARLAAG